MALLKRFLAAQRRGIVNWDERRRHRPALPALDPRDRGIVAASASGDRAVRRGARAVVRPTYKD